MNRNKVYPWRFALPAAVIFFSLCLLPGLVGIGYSFTDWNNFTDQIHFVGLANYKQIFTGHSEYLGYIGNTLLFTAATTVTKTLLGLLLALLLTRPFIRLRNMHRMIIFSPQVMSYLVVGLVFQSMLHPTTGFLNNFLRSIGLVSTVMYSASSWQFATISASASTICVWGVIGYAEITCGRQRRTASATACDPSVISIIYFSSCFISIPLPGHSSAQIPHPLQYV